jgi:hypothetical protein
MERPSESLKSFANHVARLAASESAAQLTSLLRLAGLVDDPSGRSNSEGAQRGATDVVGSPDRVGIWEKKQEDGQTVFVRSREVMKDWNYWANLGRIELKGAKKRVLLIGESVARGYLYDPIYTPAMVLEKMLESRFGPGQVEVIDLARTNIGLEVRELAISALQLEPDALVMFSGNNWRAGYPLDPRHVPVIDTALREKGIAGVKQFADESLGEEVRSVVRDISTAYADRKIPIVWIVPEFNLMDWREPLISAPHLPDGANRTWLELWERARMALENGSFPHAKDLAQKMLDLDAGLCVVPLYILAECSRHAGDREATRRYLELARDSSVWDPSISASARPLAVSQRSIREEARKTNHEVVDMPEILKEYLKGEIPDRRLFLDYCHHTTEGIQISMAATAAAILRRLKGEDVPWRSLVKDALAPSREVEAEAAFLSAVHSAHWWQSYDVVLHHCRQAVRFSRHITQVMKFFVDLQTRRTPMLMCQAAERISELKSPLLQHYLLRYNHQQLDVVLLDAIANAMKELDIDAEKDLQRLRQEEHSVRNRDIDLLEYYFNSAGLQPQEVMWVLPRQDRITRKAADYYRAYGLDSKFMFIGERDCPLQFTFTCRLPGHAAFQGAVTIHLNDKQLAELPAASSWSTWDITVPGNVVQDGCNKVVVRWPMPEFPGQHAYAGIQNDLIMGNIPEFYCIFGEIHTFTVANPAGTKTTVPLEQHELSAIGK